MREVVINDCYGGFSLSPLATLKLAKLKGKDCYFFNYYNFRTYTPLTLEQAEKDVSWFAYSVPNPKDYNTEEIYLPYEEIKRDDVDLIKVIKELGKKADGRFASLKIVKIPDNINYVIEEYDGMEHIAESHRTWS